MPLDTTTNKIAATQTDTVQGTQFTFSVSLSLPTGTLYASSETAGADSSARKAFAELETQIKKHQARLRKGH